MNKNRSYFDANREQISKIHDQNLKERHFNKAFNDPFYHKTMEGLYVRKDDQKGNDRETEEMMDLVKQLIKQGLPFSVLS